MLIGTIFVCKNRKYKDYSFILDAMLQIKFLKVRIIIKIVSSLFRKAFLQNTYGLLLLEVVSEKTLKNCRSGKFFNSSSKDEHVVLYALKSMIHVFRMNKTCS